MEITNEITSLHPVLPGFEFAQGPIVSEVGIMFGEIPPDMDEIDRIIAQACRLGESLCWIIGDAINYRATIPGGEDWPRLAAITGKKPEWLMRVASVAKRVTLTERRARLSFSHHMAVVALPANQRNEWLDCAESHALAADRLKKSVLLGRIATDSDMAAAADKKEWTPQVPITDLIRWANRERREKRADQWPREYRAALKADLEPIVEFYNSL